VRAQEDSCTVGVTGGPEQVQQCHQRIEQLLGFAVSTEPLVKVNLDIDPSTYGRLIGE
jgi:hypothetical protein